jgi:hypothetical protein
LQQYSIELAQVQRIARTGNGSISQCRLFDAVRDRLQSHAVDT